MYFEAWQFFVGSAVFALDIIATVLVLYGAFFSLFKFIKVDILKIPEDISAKRFFIKKIILSLDFFVASDLLRLMLNTSFYEIVSIFLIVIIRTILWWSLHKEIEVVQGRSRK